MKLVIYLLPHQDDEIFVIPKIMADIKDGSTLALYFLTISEVSELHTQRRDFESKRFLNLLGVQDASIHAIGRNLSIRDGHLIDHLLELYPLLEIEIRNFKDRDNFSEVEVVCPAFEGGHQDHDAALVLASKIAYRFDCNTKEFFLYNARKRLGKLYSVSSPIEFGQFETFSYGLRGFFFLFVAPFFYTSQIKAMIGLWPFLLMKAIFGKFRIRSFKFLKNDFIYDHLPMYERWGRMKQDYFIEKIKIFYNN